MPIDVVFLKQGSTNPLRSAGHLFAWREEDPACVRADMWELSAHEIVRLALNGSIDPIEVFLCLKVDQLSDLLNRYFLSDLVRMACYHSMGANVYVVVDQMWDPLNDLIVGKDLIHRIDSLCEWFKAIHEAGATDVIQASIKPSLQDYIWDDSDSLVNLLSGADSSRQRQKALLPDGNWKGLRRKEDKVLRQFLAHLEIYSDIFLPPSVQGNIVTILEESTLQRQKKLIDKAMTASKGKHLIAMRHRWTASDYIENLNRDQQVEIISYCGSFELRYLFHLLNVDSPSLANHTIGRVESVTTDNPALFYPAQITNQPCLLATNAFHPSSLLGEWHSLQGIKEIGESTLRRPSHAKYVVHPASDCLTLPGLIRNLPAHLTAWLHVGHGEKHKGLQEASGNFQTAQRWLDCFKGHAARGGSLALAIFSACETEEIARRFAQAGVGVAIGFKQPVQGEACRLLTAKIINAALRSKGDRKAILQAFHAGCADLEILGYTDLGPVAFCS